MKVNSQPIDFMDEYWKAVENEEVVEEDWLNGIISEKEESKSEDESIIEVTKEKQQPIKNEGAPQHQQQQQLRQKQQKGSTTTTTSIVTKNILKSPKIEKIKEEEEEEEYYIQSLKKSTDNGGWANRMGFKSNAKMMDLLLKLEGTGYYNWMTLGTQKIRMIIDLDEFEGDPLIEHKQLTEFITEYCRDKLNGKKIKLWWSKNNKYNENGKKGSGFHIIVKGIQCKPSTMKKIMEAYGKKYNTQVDTSIYPSEKTVHKNLRAVYQLKATKVEGHYKKNKHGLEVHDNNGKKIWINTGETNYVGIYRRWSPLNGKYYGNTIDQLINDDYGIIPNTNDVDVDDMIILVTKDLFAESGKVGLCTSRRVAKKVSDVRVSQMDKAITTALKEKEMEDKKEKDRQAKKLKAKADTEEMIDNDSEDEEEPTMKYPLETIAKVMDKCLAFERCDFYPKWRDVAFALITSFGSKDKILEVFHAFSKRSPKFEEYGYRELVSQWDKWVAFNEERTGARCNAGSIIKWAREDNEVMANKILGKEKKSAFETETILAEFLVNNYEHFFWSNSKGKNELYVWDYNNRKWLSDPQGKHGPAYHMLCKFLVKKAMPYFKKYKKEAAEKLLGKLASRLKIVEATCDLLDYKSDVVWEKNPLLLGYENGVLNILTGEFRPKTPEDYIKMTTRRMYVKPTKQQLEEVWKFIHKVFYIEELREYMLRVCSTCMYGKTIQHFYILNGCGSNGKGTWDDLLMVALGQYAILGKNALLLADHENKSDPFLAALENVRAIFFRELRKGKPLHNGNIKLLTGDNKISARGHYENANETEKKVCATVFAELNQKPMLQDEPDVAEQRRIRDVPFTSQFKEDPSEVDEENGIFLANPKYKDEDWQNEHADALLHVLIKYFKIIYADQCRLLPPPIVQKRSLAYLAESSQIVGFFNSFYTKQPADMPIEEKTIIKLSKLYAYFVSKFEIQPVEKRTKNQNWFKKELLNNFEMKKYFYEEKRIDGVKHYAFLLGWLPNDPDQIDYQTQES